jgi:predicted nucleic acid-binding Zn ribbon protein
MAYGAAYTNSCLSKYFRSAVLPLSPELEALFDAERSKPAIRECAVCGAEFSPFGRGRFCSDKCRAKSKRNQDRESLRKYRRNKGPAERK